MSVKLNPVKGMSWKIRDNALVLLAINGQYTYLDPEKVTPKSAINTGEPNEFGNEEVELTVLRDIGNEARIERIEGDNVLIGDTFDKFNGSLYLEKMRIDKVRGRIPPLKEGYLLKFKWREEKSTQLCGVYLNAPTVITKSPWGCKPDPLDKGYLDLIEFISNNKK